MKLKSLKCTINHERPRRHVANTYQLLDYQKYHSIPAEDDPHEYGVNTSINSTFLAYLIHSFIETALQPILCTRPEKLVTRLIENLQP